MKMKSKIQEEDNGEEEKKENEEEEDERDEVKYELFQWESPSLKDAEPLSWKKMGSTMVQKRKKHRKIAI